MWQETTCPAEHHARNFADTALQVCMAPWRMHGTLHSCFLLALPHALLFYTLLCASLNATSATRACGETPTLRTFHIHSGLNSNPQVHSGLNSNSNLEVHSALNSNSNLQVHSGLNSNSALKSELKPAHTHPGHTCLLRPAICPLVPPVTLTSHLDHHHSH